MVIHLAADHAGFNLKEHIKQWLKEQGYEVKDHGAFQYDEDDDYPDFVQQAAKAVHDNPADNKAIILGGSGQGEAMAANRYANVRAVVYYGGPEEIVKLSRQHNDANVLSLGARFLNDTAALKAVKIWLEENFSGEERHQRRINKIERLI